MYIDKLLNLIGYNSDYVLNNLDLDSLKLDREQGELYVVLKASKPLELIVNIEDNFVLKIVVSGCFFTKK